MKPVGRALSIEQGPRAISKRTFGGLMARQLIHVSQSRMFKTLYRGRYRIVIKTTWFLHNGKLKHVLELTDAAKSAAFKRWEWIEDN